MSDIELVIVVNITDMDELVVSAADYGCDIGSIEEKVTRVAVGPDNAPLDHGYEIMTINTTATTTKQFEIAIGINVSDERKMIAEARKCYEGVWQDSEWRPASLGEAAYELLCASNERPGADLLGFEFVSQDYLKDRAVDPEALLAASAADDIAPRI